MTVSRIDYETNGMMQQCNCVFVSCCLSNGSEYRVEAFTRSGFEPPLFAQNYASVQVRESERERPFTGARLKASGECVRVPSTERIFFQRLTYSFSSSIEPR